LFSLILLGISSGDHHYFLINSLLNQQKNSYFKKNLGDP
jgi:hypothetical protein